MSRRKFDPFTAHNFDGEVIFERVVEYTRHTGRSPQGRDTRDGRKNPAALTNLRGSRETHVECEASQPGHAGATNAVAAARLTEGRCKVRVRVPPAPPIYDSAAQTCRAAKGNSGARCRGRPA